MENEGFVDQVYNQILSRDLAQSDRTNLNKYWPVFAYASCNNPGLKGGSISQRKISEQADHIESHGDLYNLLSSAVRNGFITHESQGDYKITEEGAKIIQEGFGWNERNILYEEKDWSPLLNRLGYKPESEQKSEAIDESAAVQINEILEEKGRLPLNTFANNLDISKEALVDYFESHDIYDIDNDSVFPIIELDD